jgi:hypothetical protein
MRQTNIGTEMYLNVLNRNMPCSLIIPLSSISQTVYFDALEQSPEYGK